MRRRNRQADLDYWPAVADVFMAAFSLVLLLWLVHVLHSSLKLDKAAGDTGVLQQEIQRLNAKIAELETVIEKLKTENAILAAAAARVPGLEKELADIHAALAAAAARIPGLEQELAAIKIQRGHLLNDQPPVIDLTDRANFKFDSGSANPTANFLTAFENSTELKRIPEIVKTYGVNLIEVIGHTDAAPISSPASNLDQKLGHALTGQGENPNDPLRYGSNADLGLMRAVSVRRLLMQKLQQWNLTGVSVRCYSAAQGVIPGGDSLDPADYGREAAADDSRRRIEIRFTRLPSGAPPSK
jgi:outer membrane protein OmpA-like peptidoglycan-associated protein